MSDRILKGYAPSTTALEDAYTVPDGPSVRVASIRVANRYAGNNDLVIGYGPGGAVDDPCQHFYVNTVAAGVPVTVPFSILCHPGDVFRVSASHAATFTFMGG